MSEVLESLISDLNDRVFYREFSFAKSEFVGDGLGKGKEFADHVVWIDDLLIIYQAKERTKQKGINAETERAWFEKKVIGTATKQVRDTLDFLEKGSIKISNSRGHEFDFDTEIERRVLKLVLYDPSKDLPADCRTVKHHESSTAGFIHVLTKDDYYNVCGILVTPAEVCEYFDYRERVLTEYGDQLLPSEDGLLGHFVGRDPAMKPDERSAEALVTMDRDLDFDMWFVFDGIADRIERAEDSDEVTDYYRIIAEFAKLNRLELAQVKTRFKLCLEAADEDTFMAPTRMISTATGCGFVFMAAVEEFAENQAIGLQNLTFVSKYDQRLDRHVGVSIAKEGREYMIYWCFVDSPWQQDPEMDERLQTSNPFGPLKYVAQNRY